jgi:hypothetical protein
LALHDQKLREREPKQAIMRVPCLEREAAEDGGAAAGVDVIRVAHGCAQPLQRQLKACAVAEMKACLGAV